jgi:hypothetical protein
MVDILKNIMNIAYRVRDMQIAGTLSMVLFGVVLVFGIMNCVLGYRLLRFWMMIFGFLIGAGIGLFAIHQIGFGEKVYYAVGMIGVGLLLAILSVLLTLFFTLFLNPIICIAFDREFARSQRIPVALFEYILMMFIALTIVSCLRMVGIVLAISLLTLPQMTANLFTHSFKKIIWWSVITGYAGCLGGLFISYKLQVPSGAAIIFFSILIYTFCKMGKSMYLCKQKKLNQTNGYGN